MRQRFRGIQQPFEVTGLSIPDEDLPGWLKFLEEENFDPEFIESFLVHLNPAYRETIMGMINDSQSGAYDEFAKAMDGLIGYEEEKLGRKMSVDERKKFISDFYQKFKSDNPD